MYYEVFMSCFPCLDQTPTVSVNVSGSCNSDCRKMKCCCFPFLRRREERAEPRVIDITDTDIKVDEVARKKLRRKRSNSPKRDKI